MDRHLHRFTVMFRLADSIDQVCEWEHAVPAQWRLALILHLGDRCRGSAHCHNDQCRHDISADIPHHERIMHYITMPGKYKISQKRLVNPYG
jgi:hypothetical protein